EGLGAIAGRDAEDAEQDRDGFQGIRRGEAAIEYREGERPELAGLPPLEAREIGMEASQPRDHFPRIGMARESDRELGDGAVAGEAAICRAVDRDRAVLAGVVTPDAADHEAMIGGPDGDPDPCARAPSVEIRHGLAAEHRDAALRRRRETTRDRQAALRRPGVDLAREQG